MKRKGKQILSLLLCAVMIFTLLPATAFAAEGDVTVTFSSNGGGTEADPATITVESGGTVTLPTTNPTKSGYTFAGWNTAADASGTAFTAFTAVTGNITVYAVWYENLTGSGTDADPYVIGTAEQLRSMAYFVNNDNAQYGDKYFRQTADIDLGARWTQTGGGSDAALTGGRAWTPIGDGTGGLQSGSLFTGTFDGGGHAISGLYINTSDGNAKGLFGSVMGGDIKNAGVVDSYIKGRGARIGGVAGSIGPYINIDTWIWEYPTLSNCYNEGTTVVSLGTEGSASHAGGVVGYVSQGTVAGCYNTGRVIARSSGGGVAAFTYNESRFENCYNAGQVSSSVRAGGLVGWVSGTLVSELVNCYNSGVVSAGSYTGAIAGEVGDAGIVLTNVYYLEGSAAAAIGRVTGAGSVGGNAVYVSTAELNSGEICYLLQVGQSRQVWGQTAPGGTNYPRLAYEGGEVKEAVRVRFYDDAGSPSVFALDSTRYTVAGGTVDFPATADVTWLDGAGVAYTEGSTFNADTDLYTSRTGSVPVIVTESLPNGTTGTAYNASLSATGGGEITWTKLGALPAGLNFSNTGTVSGTPTAAGTFSVSFQAANAYGSSAVKTLTITVNDPPQALPDYGVSLSQSGTYTFPDFTGYGAPTLVVTVSNAGTNATGDLTVALSGDTSGEYVLSTTSIGSLLNDTATFTIMLDANLTIAGTHAATVTVSNSEHGISASFEVSFTVTAASYGVSLDQTDTYAFADKTVGYSIGSITPLTVTLTNTGTRETGALTAAAGTKFTVSKTSIGSIPVGGSTTFTVKPVTNLGAGTHTGTVTVSGGNGITAGFPVSFTVSAAQYAISLNKSGIHTFAGQTVGYSAIDPLSVTVTNLETATPVELTVSLGGANPTSFGLSGLNMEIMPDQEDYFGVAPNTGLAAGTYTAMVTVSGDNVASQTFVVSFTVNPAAAEGDVTVTFNSNGGGTEASPASATVTSGGTVTLPTTNPTKSGYTFAGWNTAADASGTAFTAFTAVTGNITVYAVWYENLTGSGTDADPYVIGTAEQLRSMAYFVNNDNAQYGDKYFRQTADIDLGARWTQTGGGSDAALTGGRAWTPIGDGTGGLQSGSLFTGTFDGGGHAISGLYINTSDGNAKGLFGSVMGGDIKNAGVVDSYIKGRGARIGGVAGSIGPYINIDTWIWEYPTLSNCYNEGTTVVSLGTEGSASHAGGVVGYVSQGTVAGCYNTGRVIARSSGGGVAAFTYNESRFENCYNAGQVSSSVRAGGLVGWVSGTLVSELVNCYNSGVVSAGSYTGAIAGEVGDAGIVLTNVYYLEGSAAAAIGRVTGAGSVGGNAVYVSTAELNSGEICYLLQVGQSRQVWGQTAPGGTNYPRLAYEGGEVKEAVRVRFYDDAGSPSVFALDSTRYTVAGGTVDFPATADVTWLDGAGVAYTEGSTFNADTDLYTSRTGSVPVIVTESLPNGTTGTAYNASLSATGGGEITWTKLGALPAGLNFSNTGTVSGTPTAAGTFSVSFQAANAYGSSAVKTLTITVNDPPQALPDYGVSLSQSGTYTFPDFTGYGAPTLVVTVSNAGTNATGDLTVALSGDTSGEYVLSTTSIGSLLNDTATFTIMLDANLTIAGTHAATVTVSNSEHGISASFEVSFTVTAASYGVSLDQTDTYAFADKTVGYSIGSITPLTVTLTNTGTRETGALTAAAGTKFTVSKTSIGSIPVGGSTTFTVKPVTNLGVGTHTGTVTVSGGNEISASFPVSFTVSAPTASIASTNPTSLTEASSNDGSLASGTVVITIANGTLADPLVKADVTATNLPSGLDYSVTRDSDTQLTVTISGNAASHADADDVSDLTFTIAQTKVNGATGDLATENISIDFNDPSTDKTLVSITAPDDITGVANGTAKSASALGLPAKVTLVTDDGNVQADVDWDVASSSYDPDDTAEQAFTVDGTVTLPSGVINPDGVSLDVSIDVTVNAAASTDKTLLSVTAPDDITGVPNGTAKTASALGLPAKVTLVTDGGNVQADVDWDVASSSYDPDDTGKQTFTVDGTVTLPGGVINPDSVSLDVTISVSVRARSKGGGSAPLTPSTPEYKADVNAGNGSNTALPVTVDKNSGSASVDVGSKLVSGVKTIVITVPSVPDVDIYTLAVPVPNLMAPDEQGEITFKTDIGNVTVPSNMLTGVEKISGSKAQVSIGQGDKDTLPADVKAAIGDRPLIQLTLSIDGKQTDWSNPSAPVTVSIPYTPTVAELANPESIIIWYIDGDGDLVTVPDGHYDAATGTVTFNTTHFSIYAVAYNPVSFNDIPFDAWYHDAVRYLAARQITSGTGDGSSFSPDVHLTRGEFIVLMMKAYGIAPDANPADNFADAGNTYYTGYLAAAKRLGITSGVGDNMYAPGNQITRQEMFTLLYNALKVIGQLPTGDYGKTLSEFTDAAQISSWAREAMARLVETGTISGGGLMLNPTGMTTRAEMAQVLYNLLSK